MSFKYLFVSLTIAVTAFVFNSSIYAVEDSQGPSLPNPGASSPTISGLKIDDQVTGEGEVAVNGAKVTIDYVMALTDGTEVANSVETQEPLTFVLGAGALIPGMELGIRGMKVGGLRKLTISPELAYGELGAGHVIPPNATLIVNVTLLAVAPSKIPAFLKPAR